MQHDNCYLLGYILRTHGIKGDLTIFLDVDDPAQYEEMDSVLVETKGELVPYFIEYVNIQRQGRAIVRFESQNLIGMDYQGSEVLIPIIDQFVLRADKAAKQLHVNLPEGLLDVYLSEQTPDDGDED